MTLLSFLGLVFLISSIPCSGDTKPGCPPPVAEFVDVRKSVKIPKISLTKVATLTVKENAYFGKARCSLLQVMDDPQRTIYKNFKVEEGPSLNSLKYCTVWMTATNFKEEKLEINVLLVVDLLPGLQTYCDTTVSAVAKIDITFCDDRLCDTKEWEIVENVVNFKGARGLTNGGAELQSTEGTEMGQDPDSDVDKKLILGLALIVTLVTFSLILGLIYFWCPGICCCIPGRRRQDGEMDTTKILTVRDSEGRIIEDAKSVEVWKTKENKIRSLDVLENVAKKSGNYAKLENDSGSSTLYSDFERRRSYRQEEGLKVINAGNNLDGLIILRKPRTPERMSRLTFIEELNPNHLHKYGPRSVSENSRFIRVQNDYNDYDRKASHRNDIQIVKVSRNERIGDQPLSFSRHYASDTSSRSSSLTKEERHGRSSPGRKDQTGDRRRKQSKNRGEEVRHYVERSPYIIPSSNNTRVEILKVNGRNEYEEYVPRKHKSHKHRTRQEDDSVRHNSLGNGMVENTMKSSLTESARDLKNIANEFENAEVEKPEPLSKQLAENLGDFHDHNRTPSPAANITENLLQGARNRRREAQDKLNDEFTEEMKEVSEQ